MLINSVLSSLPLYYFSFYKAPKKVLNELVQLQRTFLWGGNEEHRKIAWVSWKTICLPKGQGGLGIKNLEAFNIALLCKWRWRCLIGGDALWYKVLVAKYGHVSKWRDNHVSLYSLRNASIWWRDISLLGNEFTGEETWFNRVTRLRLGRGNKALFWKNPWCGTTPFCDLFPDLYEACGNKGGAVNEFGDWVDGVWRWRLNMVGEEENANYLRGILGDVALWRNTDDEWVWIGGSKNSFSVSQCYSWLLNIFAGAQFGDQIADTYTKLWRCNVPTKAKVLVWRLFMNRLPTRVALARRGVHLENDDSRCACCLGAEENANHVFFECRIAKEVWHKVCLWADMSDLTEILAVDHFCRFGQQLKGTKLKRLKFLLWIATVWAVWNARNKKIFEGVACNVKNIVNHIKMLSWGWFESRGGSRSHWNYGNWLNCPVGCMSSL